MSEAGAKENKKKQEESSTAQQRAGNFQHIPTIHGHKWLFIYY